MTAFQDRRGGSDDDEVVKVHGLVKSIGRARVLDDVGLRVHRGEIHAVLGPDGAGKTTLLRILAGQLSSDAGTVLVFGVQPWREPSLVHRRTAMVLGEVALWPALSGGAAIERLAAQHGGVDPERRDSLLALLGLDPSRSVHRHHGSERRKLALVAALSGRAELVLLDEPMAGLTEPQKDSLRLWLRTRRATDQTVLLAGHVLSELESAADRITIMQRGRVVDSGSPAEVRQLTRTFVSAELDCPAPDLEDLAEVHNFVRYRNTVHCEVDTDHLDQVLRRLLDCGLRSLTSRPATLQDLLQGERMSVGRVLAEHGSGS
ncbi:MULTISPECIES: ABC transporter ATP-binding protein [unclassified Nocardia]|uniref:ABC transporter ATP-binding protein n=1 Tax=unclassified Nocardia TaxID=2637762 RepID=UPI001CE47262|nr:MULTISPECIES: ABC transporter ATP-binding protein [unclassified Nocardia]